MKRAILFIIAFWLILYIGFSFAFFTFNPIMWGFNYRCGFATACGFCTPLAIMIAHLTKPEEDN